MSLSSYVNKLRTVMHMDMDCFYAQVERERFPEWTDEPVAVVQNGTLCVAVNYSVRLRGSKKIAMAGQLYKLLPQTKFAGSNMVRYRAMSRCWDEIVRKYPNIIVQKRSIDECYVDLTELVKQQLLSIAIPHPFTNRIRSNLLARHQEAMRAIAADPELAREATGRLPVAQEKSRSTDPISQQRGVGKPIEEKVDLESLLRARNSYTYESLIEMGLSSSNAQAYLQARDIENTIGLEAFKRVLHRAHPTEFCRAAVTDTVPRFLLVPTDVSDSKRVFDNAYVLPHFGKGRDIQTITADLTPGVKRGLELGSNGSFTKRVQIDPLEGDTKVEMLERKMTDLNLPQYPVASIWVGNVLYCDGDAVRSSIITPDEYPWITIEGGLEAGRCAEEFSYQELQDRFLQAARSKPGAQNESIQYELQGLTAMYERHLEALTLWTGHQQQSTRGSASNSKVPTAPQDGFEAALQQRLEQLSKKGVGCLAPSLAYLLSDKYCMRCFGSLEGRDRSSMSVSSCCELVAAADSLAESSLDQLPRIRIDETHLCSTRPDAALRPSPGALVCKCKTPFVVLSKATGSSSPHEQQETDARKEAVRIHTLMLCIASQIAYRIRYDIHTKLGLTTSAAVAPNCMLAKLASQSRKPNQQSVILPTFVRRFMSEQVLADIPGFGPKSQEYARKYGLTRVSQIQDMSLPTLVALFQLRPPSEKDLERLASSMAQKATSKDSSIVAPKESSIPSPPPSPTRGPGSPQLPPTSPTMTKEMSRSLALNEDHEDAGVEHITDEDGGEEANEESDDENNPTLDDLRRCWLEKTVRELEENIQRSASGGSLAGPSLAAAVTAAGKEGALEMALWLHKISLGIDDSPVEPTAAPKSLAQSKNQRVSSQAEKMNLLRWLVESLVERIETDRQLYSRMPTTLILGGSFTATSHSGGRARRHFTRRSALPLPSMSLVREAGTVSHPMYIDTVMNVATKLLAANVKSNEALSSMSLSVVTFVPFNIPITAGTKLGPTEANSRRPVSPPPSTSPMSPNIKPMTLKAVAPGSPVSQVGAASPDRESRGDESAAHLKIKGGLYRALLSNRSKTTSAVESNISHATSQAPSSGTTALPRHEPMTADSTKEDLATFDEPDGFEWPILPIFPPRELDASFHKLSLEEALALRRSLEEFAPQRRPKPGESMVDLVAEISAPTTHPALPETKSATKEPVPQAENQLAKSRYQFGNRV